MVAVVAEFPQVLRISDRSLIVCFPEEAYPFSGASFVLVLSETGHILAIKADAGAIESGSVLFNDNGEYLLTTTHGAILQGLGKV